jgi:hypothetical protein
MKKISFVLLFLVTTWLFADAKDDWSFELAGAIGKINEAVGYVERYGWPLDNSFVELDKKIATYISLIETGFRQGFITQEQYAQKIEAINAVKRRMLQILGAKSEGLGL